MALSEVSSRGWSSVSGSSRVVVGNRECVCVCVAQRIWQIFADGGQDARHHWECWECWMPFHNDLCLSCVCVCEREISERRKGVSKWP